jgi:glycosyltransferase involved in cell wall biosynthesis
LPHSKQILMKVLFYNHTGQVSGAERVLLMILARLDRRRFDPLIICPEQGPLLSMATDLGVPVESVSDLEARFTWRVDHLLRYLKSFFLVIRQLRSKVVSTRPDLIHANSIRAGLVATAATLGLGTRVVWHLHDLLPRHPLSTGVRFFAFLCSRARMIAVSVAVAENFGGALIGLKNRMTVILNAIDQEAFQPNQTARARVRDELNLSERQPIIGIVGQLTPRKGQLELIRAFAKVVEESPKAVLLVVGAPLFNRDHEYERLLRDTSRQLGIDDRVRLLGARNDVGPIMQALDLLVISSSVEPFGLVAVEAMASGTPVLAAASDGLTEIIEHGIDGWLVPPGDEAALVAAILELSCGPELCARLAQAGKKKVAARFLVDRYMIELERFYESTMAVRSEASAAESTIKPAEAKKFVELVEQ